MDSMSSNTERPKVILFVGSNPSNASTCDVAFHGSTASSRILTGWCKDLVGMKVHVNVLDKKTPDNRALTKSEIVMNLEDLKSKLDGINPNYIVALGKTAETALTLLQKQFYAMPHPSGCNRLLNDKEFVDQKLKGLAEFCSTSPETK